ncbi:MAG: lactonase family protein, partial [Gammaproteobacteria bacterium]|nr:lactonase family protein [Gammaproteobacteria bacterium]
LLGDVVSGGITLNWDAVDNATSYTLSRNGTIPLEPMDVFDNRYVDSGTDSSPIVNNSYAYKIATCNEVGCSANAIFTANYFPLNLEKVFNIPDDEVLKLGGAQSARVAKIDGSSYLFVAGKQDDAVSVFSIADNGALSNVANVEDGDHADLELDGAHSVTLANVSGNNYLFVAGYEDRGVSIFSVADNGALTSVDNLDDSSNENYQLREASSVKVANINGSSYLFVSGKQDDGVSVFSVADNGSLTNVDNVDRRDDRDNPNEALNGASSVAIANINGNSYLFVAARDVDGGKDGGVSVFGVANNGSLENLHNIYDSDNPSYKLKGAISLTVAVLDGTSYLFVAGFGDGVSVFSIAADGSLDNVANVADSDNPAYEIKSPYFVTVAEIGGSSYLFVAGNADDGVSVFSVAADGSLTNVANMATNISPTSVTVAEIGGSSYLFVTEFFNGVSVIKLTQ